MAASSRKRSVQAAYLLTWALLTAACGGGSSTPAAAPSPSLDANKTCAAEITFASGVLDTGDRGVTALTTAIGQENPQFTLALHLVGPLNELIRQQGISAALPALTQQAQVDCSRAADPLLTRGQLDSLKQIVPPDNAVALEKISLFASVPAVGPAPTVPAAAPTQETAAAGGLEAISEAYVEATDGPNAAGCTLVYPSDLPPHVTALGDPKSSTYMRQFVLTWGAVGQGLSFSYESTASGSFSAPTGAPTERTGAGDKIFRRSSDQGGGALWVSADGKCAVNANPLGGSVTTDDTLRMLRTLNPAG